ncbi:MAG TPA: CxxxxCH/CxxCH domain-containing protein [Anaeromyxobacteraceae bacterium]|nr:CxxxxCH/CxxCH domain-containing protein [Anaeromyxobacteraceae bacterium]
MAKTTAFSAALSVMAFALAACGTAQPTAGGGGGGSACTTCHGDFSRTANMGGTDPDLGAAPPAAPAGQPSDVIGAHLAHVNPAASGSLRGPMHCDACHNPVPTDASHATNPPANIVVFGALAFGPSVTTDGTNPNAPKWNGVHAGSTITNPTCSAVYCHGSFRWFADGADGADIVGNAFTPDWTQGASEITCGSCHSLPPTGHIQNAFIGSAPVSPTVCNGCHPGTVAPDGTIVVDAVTGLSDHINGAIDEGAHPDPTWPNPNVHGYAAVQATGGLQSCVKCHTGFDSPLAPPADPGNSCNACHGSALSGAATSNWQQNCVFCHGDKSKLLTWTPSDPQYEMAPPVGPLGESSTSTLAVGAHQQHVQAGAGFNTLSQPFACSECHPSPIPTDIAHVNGGPVPVPLTGVIATSGTVLGTWGGPAQPTCSSTYCHGNFLGGNKTNTPTWIQVDGTYAACGSCHGIPPTEGQHVFHASQPPTGLGIDCGSCHTGYSLLTTSPTVNVTLHVNGVFDVGGTSVTTWDPTTLTCTNSCHVQRVW